MGVSLDQTEESPSIHNGRSLDLCLKVNQIYLPFVFQVWYRRVFGGKRSRENHRHSRYITLEKFVNIPGSNFFHLEIGGTIIFQLSPISWNTKVEFEKKMQNFLEIWKLYRNAWHRLIVQLLLLLFYIVAYVHMLLQSTSLSISLSLQGLVVAFKNYHSIYIIFSRMWKICKLIYKEKAT